MAELTINKAFQEVFGKELEKHGFYKMKRSKYYVKLINGEIFQYISYINNSPGRKGYHGFEIVVGVLTIYSQTLDSKELIRRANGLLSFGRGKYPVEERDQLFGYTYNDSNTLIQTLKISLEKTKELVLPVLEGIKDLKSFIEFRKYQRPDFLCGADRLEEDSILLIKTDNHEDLMEFFEKKLAETMEAVKRGDGGGDYEYHYKMLYHSIIQCIAEPRDKVYSDEKLYARVMEELERRKEQNLKILQSHGVI